MNVRRLVSLTTLLIVAAVPTAHAELSSKARVAAFAKLPNWSGIWEQFNIGPSGFPSTAAEFQLALKIAGEQLHPPYNAEWQAKFDSVRDAVRNHSADIPEQKSCLWGFPGLTVWSPFTFQASVTPEETTLTFAGRETRHILTDSRRHPPADELFTTPWGDSIGHWAGQTLVIDTVGTSSVTFGTDEMGNFIPVTFSEQAHFIERIRMLDKNTLEDQITIEDPIAFTRPWTLMRQYHRVTTLDRLIDEDCTGNDRNPVVNGKFIIAPSKP